MAVAGGGVVSGSGSAGSSMASRWETGVRPRGERRSGRRAGHDADVGPGVDAVVELGPQDGVHVLPVETAEAAAERRDGDGRDPGGQGLAREHRGGGADELQGGDVAGRDLGRHAEDQRRGLGTGPVDVDGAGLEPAGVACVAVAAEPIRVALPELQRQADASDAVQVYRVDEGVDPGVEDVARGCSGSWAGFSS